MLLQTTPGSENLTSIGVVVLLAQNYNNKYGAQNNKYR